MAGAWTGACIEVNLVGRGCSLKRSVGAKFIGAMLFMLGPRAMTLSAAISSHVGYDLIDRRTPSAGGTS